VVKNDQFVGIAASLSESASSPRTDIKYYATNRLINSRPFLLKFLVVLSPAPAELTPETKACPRPQAQSVSGYAHSPQTRLSSANRLQGIQIHRPFGKLEIIMHPYAGSFVITDAA
jgi:hypothetical protein